MPITHELLPLLQHNWVWGLGHIPLQKECMQECKECLHISIYVHWLHRPTSLLYKRGLHQYCCSVWKEQEKVLATVHQHSRMEREEGQVRVVPYLTRTRVRGVVWHTAPLPHQMLTAMEKTGGCVPLSELVTGVTTRRCCW